MAFFYGSTFHYVYREDKLWFLYKLCKKNAKKLKKSPQIKYR